MSQVKAQPLYQKVDQIVDFEDKFGLVYDKGLQLFTFVKGILTPIFGKIFFVCDAVTKSISSYIQVISERQDRIREYVSRTYSTITISVSGAWMRLDFDSDGSVSDDDMRKSVIGLYEFVKSFDLIEATTWAKSRLYTDAIVHMQKELDEIRGEQEVQRDSSSKSTF